MSAPNFREAVQRQVRPGRAFVLDAPDHVPAVWGAEREVLWAAGEAAIICGPQGVGKTTVLQQLALRRAGVIDGELAGYPVAVDRERLTLYMALDRPRQIARSFKRMVDESHADALERLVVWEGPLPFDLVKRPLGLVELAQEIGQQLEREVGAVFIDSTKDLAANLSSDETGGAIGRTLAALVAGGIEVMASHHQRKATSENKRPTTLSDVYGSTWITAGTGSVILLWGEPGDPLVELTHLKQPADEVGPLDLCHDHDAGATTRRDRLDVWQLLQQATRGGTTAADVAEAIHGTKPTRSQVEKARRKLERFVTEGHAARIDPPQKGEPTLYRPVTARDPRDPLRDPLTNGVTHPSRGSRNPGNTGHAASREPSAPRDPLPLKGEGSRRDVTVTLGENGIAGRTEDELQALVDAERGGLR